MLLLIDTLYIIAKDLEQLTHNEEDRKEVLEKEMEEFERKVEDADQLLGNTFLVLCQVCVFYNLYHLQLCPWDTVTMVAK